jgi:hypothetical protein
VELTPIIDCSAFLRIYGCTGNGRARAPYDYCSHEDLMWTHKHGVKLSPGHDECEGCVLSKPRMTAAHRGTIIEAATA